MSDHVDTGQEADAPYWDGLRQGRLLIQQCERCDYWQWPAVYRCSDCGTWSPPWREVSPVGTVFSWIRTHQNFPGQESLGLPFVSVLVSLDHAGGHRLMGTLSGDEAGLAIGSKVTGEIVERTLLGQTLSTMTWRLGRE